MASRVEVDDHMVVASMSGQSKLVEREAALASHLSRVLCGWYLQLVGRKVN